MPARPAGPRRGTAPALAPRSRPGTAGRRAPQGCQRVPRRDAASRCWIVPFRHDYALAPLHRCTRPAAPRCTARRHPGRRQKVAAKKPRSAARGTHAGTFYAQAHWPRSLLQGGVPSLCPRGRATPGHAPPRTAAHAKGMRFGCNTAIRAATEQVKRNLWNAPAMRVQFGCLYAAPSKCTGRTHLVQCAHVPICSIPAKRQNTGQPLVEVGPERRHTGCCGTLRHALLRRTLGPCAATPAISSSSSQQPVSSPRRGARVHMRAAWRHG